jgi:hypothetical protein
MISFDRFAHGLPDPQERPAARVGECTYEKCQSAIYLRDEVVELDGDLYCDAYCLMKHLGGRYVAAGMED